MHMRRSNKTYWKCDKPHCKARIVTHQNTVKINTEGHNHLPLKNCVGLASQVVNIIRMGPRIRNNLYK